MAQERPRVFAPGDTVQVTALGRGIVRGLRNGRYLIEIKGTSLLATAAQLTPVVAEPRARQAKTASIPEPDAQSAGSTARSLDLHGKTVIEALDALDAFLNGALLDGCSEVRIIHGRSGGRLRAAVLGRLKVVAAVRQARLDPANAGVTIVQL